MFGRHVAGDAELVNDFPHTLMSEAPLEDGNALPDERLKNDGRRTSRYRHGELVLLDDEERNPWDRERVAEGEQHLARARALYGHGAYVLRAEIASVHMAEPVDWPELVALYTELARLVPTGAVELNRAIAVAEVAGPEAALVIVERIDFEPSELDHYCSLHSTRADLLRRLGRTIDARYAYGRALQLTRSEPERRFLKRRIAELPPPAAADCEAFWDNALDRIKAAAEADEIEDAEAPAEDARAQRRRLPADAPDPAAHLEHVQPQLAKRERPPHGADH